MAHYRAYLFNSWGHVANAQDLDVPDDEAALQRAMAIGHSHAVEVWQQGRKVGLIEPAPANRAKQEGA